MNKILITLLLCAFAYVYSMYFTGLKTGNQAVNLATKVQEFKNSSNASNVSNTSNSTNVTNSTNASAGNCAEQNFCTISKDPNVSLPGIRE